MKFLSCCLIIKNESKYLDEWLSYYSLQGVEHFYVCDDSSTDGTMDILKKWEENGRMSIYHSNNGFRNETQAPQAAFYDWIRENKKDETLWCAFFDIDEFYQGKKTMSELLNELNDNVSALEISWCHYGSSGLIENDGRLVIERFLNRSVDNFYSNRLGKTVAKLRNIKPIVNFHNFDINEGRIINSNLTDITDVPIENRFIKNYAAWDVCRLNHYYTKSYCEYMRKLSKGFACDFTKRPNCFSFFNRNDIYDDSLLRWVKPVKEFRLIPQMISHPHLLLHQTMTL